MSTKGFIKKLQNKLIMSDYESMLDKAYAELPELMAESQRFTFEKVKGHIEGTKTVIINLKQIAKDLGRKPEHLLKYLLKESASAGKWAGTRAIFASKISASSLNKKIKKYASEFVFCSECGKPDTTLEVDRNSITRLKCMACGTKKPVKSIR
jgi:translation initiation factor 2 subunit 2